jgi:hypothetical protein
LPDGILPKGSWEARKAVEEGGFSRKSGELGGLRSGRQKSPAYSVTTFLLDGQGYCGYSHYTSAKSFLRK